MFYVNINEIAKLLNKNVWVVTNVNSIHNKYHVFPARITKVSIDQCSFPLLDGKPKVAYVTCSLKAFTIGCLQKRNGDILVLDDMALNYTVFNNKEEAEESCRYWNEVYSYSTLQERYAYKAAQILSVKI